MKKRRNSAGELDAKCVKAKEALLSLIAIGLPAMADTFPVSGIPTYRYFYTCDSGVVDCINFDRNQDYYGNFGTNGTVPTNWIGSGPADFKAFVSNENGEVLGKLHTTTGGALSYGYQGVVTCLRGSCNDEAGEPPVSTPTRCMCSTHLWRALVSATALAKPPNKVLRAAPLVQAKAP
jgi:hypothetical protein